MSSDAERILLDFDGRRVSEIRQSSRYHQQEGCVLPMIYPDEICYFDYAWNPILGCLNKCEYCNARRAIEHIITRLKTSVIKEPHNKIHDLENPVIRNGKEVSYPYGFEPTFFRYKLNWPQTHKTQQVIFVCNRSDLFAPWIYDKWIDEVFDACYKAPQHNYMFLTRYVERYCQYGVPIRKNMWYGVTITKESEMGLFNYLPAFCNTFVCMTPILEDLNPQKYNVMFRQVKWVIIGAETGDRNNKVVPQRKWIENIVNECKRSTYHQVPIFMKSSLAEIWGEPLIQEIPTELKSSEAYFAKKLEVEQLCHGFWNYDRDDD